MEILTEIKLGYVGQFSEADKEKVDSGNTENLAKTSSSEEVIGATGFNVDTEDKTANLSEILKMKLSDFKNTDKPIKVFSWLLGEEVYFSPSAWTTHKLELKKHGLPIYTAQELKKIVKDAAPESLKIIHKVKKVFGGSILKIEEGRWCL